MGILEGECGGGGRDGRRGRFRFFIVIVERVWDGGPIEHDSHRMGRKGKKVEKGWRRLE